MLFDIIVTLHTSIQGSTRTSVIPFAVANIKCNILVTPFFEILVKTFNIPLCETSRVIPFAVGNIKYNILVTLFFQNSVKNLIFEQMPLQFNTPHELMLPRFLLLLEKFENIHISHTKKQLK